MIILWQYYRDESALNNDGVILILLIILILLHVNLNKKLQVKQEMMDQKMLK